MKTISCTALAVLVGGIAGVTASAQTTDKPLVQTTELPRESRMPVFDGAKRYFSPGKKVRIIDNGSVLSADEMRKLANTPAGLAARTAVGDDYWWQLDPVGFVDEPTTPSFAFLGIFSDYDFDAGPGEFPASSYTFGDGSSPVDFDPNASTGIGVDFQILEVETVDPLTGNTNIQLSYLPEVPIELLNDVFQADINGDGTPGRIVWDSLQSSVGVNLFENPDLPLENGPDLTPNTADDATLTELDPLRLQHGLGSGNAGVVPTPIATTTGVVNEERPLIFEGGFSESIDPDIEPTTLGLSAFGGAVAYNNVPGTLSSHFAWADSAAPPTIYQNFGYPDATVPDDSRSVSGFVNFGLVDAPDPSDPDDVGLSQQGISGATAIWSVDPDTTADTMVTGLCCVGGSATETTFDNCNGTFYGFGTQIGDFECSDCSTIADASGVIKEPATTAGTSDATDGTADDFNGGCFAATPAFTPYELGQADTNSAIGATIQGSLFTASGVRDSDSYAFATGAGESGTITLTVSAEQPMTVTVLEGGNDVTPGPISDIFTNLNDNVVDGCADAVEVASANVGEGTTAGNCTTDIQFNVDAERFYYVSIGPAGNVSYGQALGGTNITDEDGAPVEGSVAYEFSTSLGASAAGACFTVTECTLETEADCTGAFAGPGTDCMDDDVAFCPDPFDPMGIDEGEAEFCDTTDPFQADVQVDTFNGGNFACDGIDDLAVDATPLAAGSVVNGESTSFLVPQVIDDGGTPDPGDDVLVREEILQRDIDVYEINHPGGEDIVLDVSAQFPLSFQVVRLTCPDDGTGAPQLTLNTVVEGADFGFNVGGGLDDCSASTLTVPGAGMDDPAFEPGVYHVRVSNDYAVETLCVNSGAPSRYTIGLQGDADVPCPGDTDGNDMIDLNDLLTVLSNFGQNVGGGAADGDVSPDGAPDGVVDLNDLLLVLSNFGTTCG